MAIRNARHVVSITIETGSGNTLNVGPESGNWSIAGIVPDFAEALDIKSRGTHQETVPGDDVYPTFSLAIYHDGTLSSAAIGKVYDILMGKGIYSSDDTTNLSGCGPWQVKITAVITGCDGGTDTFVMPNVRPGIDYNTAKEGNTLPITGTCYPGAGNSDPVQIS